MDDAFTQFLIAVAPLAALTIGLLELVKRQGLPTRLVPVASVACGVVMMGLVRLAGYHEAWSAWETVLAGVITAMIAGGTYSGVKAVAGRS